MDVSHGMVFRSLWEGSLVGKADEQLVFVFLIAHADAEDRVDVHPTVIAALTGLSLDRVKQALLALEAEDPDSRSMVESGRRITRLDDHRDWGWLVVNRDHYKHLRDVQERRRQNRDAQRKHRMATSVSNGHQTSAAVSDVSPGIGIGIGIGKGTGTGIEDPFTTPPAPSLRAAKPRSGRQVAEGSVSLPTNTNGEWQPTRSELDAWEAAYPSMDVSATMLEMRAWLVANPTRKKTANGMARFVNTWLAREHNRP